LLYVAGPGRQARHSNKRKKKKKKQKKGVAQQKSIMEAGIREVMSGFWGEGAGVLK